MSFYTKALTGLERNHAAYKIGLYAVVCAVKHFRIFLLDKEFLLRTDHAALRNLLRRDVPLTIWIERWIFSLSEYKFEIEYHRGQDNVIADFLSRLHFAGAKNAEKSSTLEQAHRKVNSPESEAPQLNSLEDSSSALFITDATSKCEESFKSLSDSDDSSSQYDFEQSECEIDSNSNYLDKLPEGSMPRSCNHIDVAAVFIDLSISCEGIQVNNFQIHNSNEFPTAQSADLELKQLQLWIDEQTTFSTDKLAPLSGHLKCLA